MGLYYWQVRLIFLTSPLSCFYYIINLQTVDIAIDCVI
ncbi:hypothetical protein D1BOALGB6SA_10389 [Olavius sp. associated proteobacterium Delta 1]|nr:hypothetical protein D1BOALGB6SA_10389 [Olavius sp. associated proteobacterium Delta 1]